MEKIESTEIYPRYKDRKKSMENYLSIVMPVYNRAKFLEEAIESVLKQDYVNFELIIVDDGSTVSEVGKILKKYRHYPGVSVFHKQKNEGPGSAINVGALKVKGEYFCRLDSDDMLVPGTLTVLNKYINKYPNVSYFYSSRYVIDENSKIVITNRTLPYGIIRSEKFSREKLFKEYHCIHLICWRKKDFLAVGGMREKMLWAEDWELALRMSEKYLFQNIDEVLYLVREYPTDRLTCTISDEMKNKIIQKMFKNLKLIKYKPSFHLSQDELSQNI